MAANWSQLSEDLLVEISGSGGKTGRLGPLDPGPLDLQTTIVNWTKPEVGFFKLTTDAALLQATSKVCFGLMTRDQNGHVRRSSIQSLPASFSPQITEAVAICRGVVLAVNSSFLPLVVESNTKVVIDMIKGGRSLSRYWRYDS
ncbi:hypothetical protein LWI28_005155 [Acer negundo]|uniref:RNase H type-1 domain-containing protein n=1 Tax=Acer negundo TaxID=4023 RepID=A0AAD5P0R4_ACENE|nr:hypothetical protein LWI28_005155 [Acer negundo]